MSLNITRKDFTSDSAKRFTLRMDTQLFDTISAIAKEHRRSVAKEIEQAIACYIDDYIDASQN